MRAVKILLAVVVIAWLGPTGIALWGASFDPEQCRAPYVTWAVLWPVFKWGPAEVTEPIVDWSLRQCRK